MTPSPDTAQLKAMQQQIGELTAKVAQLQQQEVWRKQRADMMKSTLGGIKVQIDQVIAGLA